MINIYFAKPSRSVDFNESVIKMTHIKSKHHTQEIKMLQKYHNCYKNITQLFRKILNW